METRYTDIEEFLHDMETEEAVLRMKQYVQHGQVSTYDHCIHVVRFSQRLNRAFHVNADPDTLWKGAMLHDFYLYDWHDEDNGTHKWHGFSHAEKAAQNAEAYFQVSKEIRHIISSHMWPLNLTRLPQTREAWLVCLADKCVSIRETMDGI